MLGREQVERIRAAMGLGALDGSGEDAAMAEAGTSEAAALRARVGKRMRRRLASEMRVRVLGLDCGAQNPDYFGGWYAALDRVMGEIDAWERGDG